MAPLSPAEQQSAERLHRHVEVLAGQIGGRSLLRPDSLDESVAYISRELSSYGYRPQRLTYRAGPHDFHNVEARTGREGAVIIGAHYDTAGGLPGANDNASGVAATLELARTLAGDAAAPALRFVFFTNEEPPYFQTPAMGSYIYAKRCRDNRENVKAMLSLETIGYYSDAPGSQTYPVRFLPGYPSVGNFLGFVSDLRSGLLLRRVLKAFRASTTLPAQGGVAPASIPGISWSDHWSFWHFGYRALMVTDTAPFRYPHYHRPTDTPDKLQYDRLAQAVTGLRAVAIDLAANSSII